MVVVPVAVVVLTRVQRHVLRRCGRHVFTVDPGHCVLVSDSGCVNLCDVDGVLTVCRSWVVGLDLCTVVWDPI